MGSPGEGLDQARSQVTDVLQMTEKATMSIMDLVEEIRGDCQTVQTKLLNLMAPPFLEEPGNLTPEPFPDSSADQRLWNQVLSQAEELDYLQRPPCLPPASPAAGVPLFSLTDILQILLEFCTNEKVKQHLKAVQAKQDAIFRTAEAELALSLLASAAGQELWVNLDDQTILPPESDLARKELDRLLHEFSLPSDSSDQEFAAPSDEQPLDQNAFNDLLTSMGF